MLRKLEGRDQKALITFLTAHRMDAISLIRSVEKSGIKAMYGYFSNQELMAVVRFSDSGTMQCMVEDPSGFGSVDLFRLIRQKSPRLLRGPKASVMPWVDIMGKRLCHYENHDNLLMTFQQDIPDIPWQATETLDPEDRFFLVEAERSFERNFLAANDLLKERRDSLVRRSFYGLRVDGKLVAQGMIEHEGIDFCLIGGIYVTPSYRRQGLGERIMEALVAEVKRRKKEPLLFVLEENDRALSLYKKMGFDTLTTYTNLRIEMG